MPVPNENAAGACTTEGLAIDFFSPTFSSAQEMEEGEVRDGIGEIGFTDDDDSLGGSCLTLHEVRGGDGEGVRAGAVNRPEFLETRGVEVPT